MVSALVPLKNLSLPLCHRRTLSRPPHHFVAILFGFNHLVALTYRPGRKNVALALSLFLLPRFPSSPSGRRRAGPTGARPPPSRGTVPPSPRPGRRRPDPRRRCAVPHPRPDRLLQLHHAADPHGVQRTRPRCGGGSASAADADASRRQHERRGGQWPPADNLRLRPDGALVVLHVQPPPSIAAGLNPGPIPFGGPSFRLGFVRTSSLRLMIGWLRRHTMEESWRLMSSAL
uniref:Uncharacterized protein n=2 Tax=Oryza TaxID=4527 RepID=A0A0E0IQH8_ORYNI